LSISYFDLKPLSLSMWTHNMQVNQTWDLQNYIDLIWPFSNSLNHMTLGKL